MSEKEARALGSGSTIVVEGKEYTLRPISVQHLCDLEREALQFYKRQYLETFKANADLLGESADDVLREKLEEVARWGLDDLPRKTAFDASRVPITEDVKDWARRFRSESGENEGELSERAIQATISTALDQERLTPDGLEKLSGKRPIQGRVRYDQWWVTGCFEGMVSFIHSSLRQDHPAMTKEEIRRWPVSAIFESARAVESVTSPDLGNG